LTVKQNITVKKKRGKIYRVPGRKINDFSQKMLVKIRKKAKLIHRIQIGKINFRESIFSF
jgi:hypothetical protein